MPDDRNIPAWQRDSRFLDEVKGLSPFRLLEAESHDPGSLEAAVQGWAGLDPEVKDYLHARLSYNLLIGIDELRRRLDRGNNHLSNIRTGTRLTVDAIERNGTPRQAPAGGGFEGDDFAIPMDEEAMLMEGTALEVDIDPELPLEDVHAMQAFEGLDQSSSGVFVAQDPEGLMQQEMAASIAPPPRAPRKRAPAKKKAAPKRKSTSRKRSSKSNGAGKPVVLDENGNPVQS